MNYKHWMESNQQKTNDPRYKILVEMIKEIDAQLVKPQFVRRGQILI